jgi:GTP cyclohydrolase IA
MVRKQHPEGTERLDIMEKLFGAVLEQIEPDSGREGLQETPRRVAKAWEEFTSGYDQDPEEVLKTFEDGAANYDELVIVHGIPVVSRCEHHLESIIGTAHVGYIPNGRVVGLSKLARLVDVFARRLQVQERLTTQIADTIEKVLLPRGVGVLITASHGCMTTRGVKIHGSKTTTSALRGVLKTEASARAEFLTLCAQSGD